MGILTTILSSASVINLIVRIVSKLIDKHDENGELKKQWVKTTRLIDKKVPIRLSKETKELIELMDKSESDEVKELQEKNNQLYSENLKLKDDIVKAKGYYEEFHRNK